MADAIGVVLVVAGKSANRVLHHLVLAVIAIDGDCALIILFQHIAIGVIAVSDTTLLGDTIIVVIAVLGGHPCFGTLGAVAYCVVKVAGGVVSIHCIGNGFAGKPIQTVVGVVTGSAIKLRDPCSATGWVQGVVK